MEYTEIYAWGRDTDGQLGLGSKKDQVFTLPKVCSFNILIRSVACGFNHTALLTDTGHLYTMGSNEDGKLGLGPDVPHSSKNVPCLVTALQDEFVRKVACGWTHSAALSDAGRAFTWGHGVQGALGLGSSASCSIPTLVPGLPPALDVSCGKDHTGFVCHENPDAAPGASSLYMCGSDEFGQLGAGGLRRNVFAPIGVHTGGRIVAVACAKYHSLALTDRGRVLTAGDNSEGQLGHGDRKGRA